MAVDTCEALRFGPVLQSSGSIPGIIPPNNPLRFAVKPESPAYLTYVQFRAGGVGTAGARLRGLYAQGSPLQAVSDDYAWAKNGPVQLPGGIVVYDSCGDCRVGFGVQDLKVTALPGAGFRALELSQLFMDTRCEGSGVNNDGMLWDGNMRYSCAQLTCGDADLDREGAQQFAGCVAPFFFDSSKASASPPSVAACCTQAPPSATCGAVVPGERYACPAGYQYDDRKNSASPPSTEACCVRTSCDSITPVTAPGTRLPCPSGYGYAPAGWPPSITTCCKLATCADTRPGSAPGTPFACEFGTVPNPNAQTASPPSQATCCLRKTCGSPDPVNAPDQGFVCAPFSEFNPGNIQTSPPGQNTCCRPRTCGNVSPVTKPNTIFGCPDETEYDPSTSFVSPPSANICCKPRTCSNMQPVTSPPPNSVKFSCVTPGKDVVFDAAASNVAPPSLEACCKPATCGDSDPSKPGTPFSCLLFGMFYNATNADKQPASVDNCCTDMPIAPQNKADVALNKTVSPPFNGNNQNSSTLLVGSEFTFKIRVEVQGERKDLAENVVMTDNLPPGLLFVSLSEQPNDKACTVAGSLVTCRWAKIDALRANAKTVTIVTRALWAGVHVNPAQVTTTTQEINPDNNFDTSTANVKGACCLRGACSEVLPASCPKPGEVDVSNGCATTITTCGRNITDETGACCINTNEVATCINRVQQAACNGIWSKGAPCAAVNCKSPIGACCEVPSGKCSDGVTRSQCPNRHSWLLNGRCGKDGWCIGGCCNEAASSCTETTAGRCSTPGKWSLYSKCDKDYCPVEPSCVPPWWSCKPSDKDPCCPGYACLPTYTGCEVGPYVCKPRAPTCEPSQCGGKHGSCCSGHGCFWDHKKRQGKCWKHSSNACSRPGGSCTEDTQCCIGSRCMNGSCQKVTKERCNRKCTSYGCFQERQRDCDCLYAAAASNNRLAVP
ncbi:hypothetical protein OEZ85_003238 [Tetradesmus obliquus]|uniref:DUF11 domain-containing protein n=1 Tax=Tetradesmus obliquus TaxID=3088 RepID=A0ABY8TZZ0_TETOB|nr:hypothetical protein OEZ85_003238 [Tetradesmus obliquus]